LDGIIIVVNRHGIGRSSYRNNGVLFGAIALGYIDGSFHVTERKSRDGTRTRSRCFVIVGKARSHGPNHGAKKSRGSYFVSIYHYQFSVYIIQGAKIPTIFVLSAILSVVLCKKSEKTPKIVTFAVFFSFVS
jgi:hypothetical protein